MDREGTLSLHLFPLIVLGFCVWRKNGLVFFFEKMIDCLKLVIGPLRCYRPRDTGRRKQVYREEYYLWVSVV